MSIITREAELKYPEGIPGMDPTPLRSGYLDGADREPTDAEVEAAAQALYEAWRPKNYPKWDQYRHCSRVEDYLAAARVTLTAARNKAMEETE